MSEPVKTTSVPGVVQVSQEALAAAPAAAKVGDAFTAPTTTEAQALTAHGQREINAKWENVQAIIALSVTWVALGAAMYLILWAKEVNVILAACVFLFGVANLVIGFYFGRTNHTRTGGVSVGDVGR